MITNDKEITKPAYWNNIYKGKNDNAVVDASNTTRPPNPFDRFAWAAKYVNGPKVLGIASGHAHIEKRIKAAHPEWIVIASDQASAAKDVANFVPYVIINGYNIPYKNKYFNTLVIAQALEYIENEKRFLNEAARVARSLVLTVPIGEMAKWSQLRIYTEGYIKTLLFDYGAIEVFEREGDLLLIKLNFKDGL
jgi:ubiquinone/menaquinone biosynthesis C-methylase UbiE